MVSSPPNGSQFDWLEAELAVIKTPQFHLVDGPMDGPLQDRVLESTFLVPESYKQFVLLFGNAKLYRLKSNGYRVGVFAAPRNETLEDGSRLLHLGFHDGASVYVKEHCDTGEFPIFEFEAEEEEKVADSFEEWLIKSCRKARDSYSKKTWAEVLRGPEPFSLREQAVVEARRQFQWQVTGIDDEGNHVFEITNRSSLCLPVLTVGVRSADRRLNGAVRLAVADLQPGQRKTVCASCYKKYLTPDETEIFALPDPEPQDRERFHEFQEIPAPETAP